MICLLFDNDGTLIQSELLCCEALAERYLAEKNISLDAHTLFSRFRGWKLADMLDTIQSETGVAWDSEFVKRYRNRMNTLLEDKLLPIDGVEEALSALPQKKAVVSNGPRNKIIDSMRITGLEKYFNGHIFSAYDIDIWKPEPGLFLHAAKEMGYAPSNCFVVEDSLPGVEAAISAGMTTFFYNKYNDTCEFANVIQFQSMHDLPHLISNQEKQFL